MTGEVKIIAARRAYEFRPNDLRLSMLSLSNVREHVKELFSFEIGEVQTPQPVFGPVPLTVPPGLVFQTGGTQIPAKTAVPIRFLHFEPQRIVVDVAGPSSAIDYIFDRLQITLAEIRAPDGSPAIGEPQRVLDYSEVSGRLSFEFGRLFNESLRQHVNGLFNRNGNNHQVFPAGIRFFAIDETQKSEFPSMYTLELRDVNQLEDEIYTSSSGLRTEDHIAWLEALEKQIK